MRWSDLPLKPSSRTLRQFAALWIIFFGGLATWYGFGRGSNTAATVLAVLAVTVGPVGLVAPAAMRPIFVTWLIVGFPIGWTISRVLLLALFFGVMLPVALIYRLRGRDTLRLAKPGSQSTLWLPKPRADNAASYFRQY